MSNQLHNEGLAPDIITFLVSVSCLIDDWLIGQRLRKRGPQPILSYAEVLTIEIVGEFLGIATEI